MDYEIEGPLKVKAQDEEGRDVLVLVPFNLTRAGMVGFLGELDALVSDAVADVARQRS